MTDAIRSLGQLEIPAGWTVEIVVADNDIEPSARDYVAAVAAEISIPVKYCHAPKQNISIARNACLQSARGDWVGFIDDDETASKGWLKEMIEATQSRQLDVAFGPVWARYPDETEDWLVEADFHSTRCSDDDGLITGYSGNSFFNVRHPAIAQRRFNLKRGRTGGEDTEFFHECYRAGAKLGYVDGAAASEPVPEDRLNMKWLAKTRYRSGVTYGKVIKYRGTRFQNAMGAISSAMKAGLLLVASALPFRTAAKNRTDYIRALFHLGTVNAFFAAREQEMYGLEVNPTSATETGS